MLLIAIVMAAATMVYFYSSGLLGSLQGAQPPKGQYANQISLEYYDWTTAGTGDSTLHTLKMTLRNVGSGIANLAAIYVSGTKANLKTGTSWICLGATTVTTTTVTAMMPSSSCSASITIPSTGATTTITGGAAYVVKLVTIDGGVFSYSCIAGQSTGSLS